MKYSQVELENMLRVMPEGAFMPVEIAQYDAWACRRKISPSVHRQ